MGGEGEEVAALVPQALVLQLLAGGSQRPRCGPGAGEEADDRDAASGRGGDYRGLYHRAHVSVPPRTRPRVWLSAR